VTTLDQNGNDQNVSQEVKNEMPQLQGKWKPLLNCRGCSYSNEKLPEFIALFSAARNELPREA
jgi:hypothetical protein